MPKFSLCIPYHADHGPRDVIFAFTLARWQTLFPHADICIGDDDTGQPLLNRCRMRNNAAKQAKTDNLIFVDADAAILSQRDFTTILKLLPTSAMIKYPGVIWVDEPDVLTLLQGADVAPIFAKYLVPDWQLYGLFFAMTRKTFDTVNGWDERFSGWGNEDPAMQCAVRGAVGPIVKLTPPIYHLWHPRTAEHSTVSEASLRNHALRLAYEQIEATGDRQAMIDYCHHRQAIVWPPLPVTVISTSCLVFHEWGGQGTFTLPAKIPTPIPHWARCSAFYHSCLNSGVIRVVENSHV